MAVALINGGADIEAPDGSIAGGTPLDNAVGYGCWRVARLLVQRGARVDKLWHAAALGILGRTKVRGASPEEINNAFWQACAGGQRRAAELMLAHGADLNWVPDYAKGTPLDQAQSIDTGRAALGLTAGTRRALSQWVEVPRAWVETGRRIGMDASCLFFGEALHLLFVVPLRVSWRQRGEHHT